MQRGEAIPDALKLHVREFAKDAAANSAALDPHGHLMHEHTLAVERANMLAEENLAAQRARNELMEQVSIPLVWYNSTILI